MVHSCRLLMVCWLASVWCIALVDGKRQSDVKPHPFVSKSSDVWCGGECGTPGLPNQRGCWNTGLDCTRCAWHGDDGWCKPGYPRGSGCGGKWDCDQTQPTECIANQCRAGCSGSCNTTKQCGHGCTCVDGECQRYYCGKKCDSVDSCSGQCGECVQGYCYAKCGGVCKKDSDCPPGNSCTTCSGGKCVKGSPRPGPWCMVSAGNRTINITDVHGTLYYKDWISGNAGWWSFGLCQQFYFGAPKGWTPGQNVSANCSANTTEAWVKHFSDPPINGGTHCTSYGWPIGGPAYEHRTNTIGFGPFFATGCDNLLYVTLKCGGKTVAPSKDGTVRTKPSPNFNYEINNVTLFTTALC